MGNWISFVSDKGTAFCGFRYKLPVIIVIINNNGIYGGMNKTSYESIEGDPALT